MAFTGFVELGRIPRYDYYDYRSTTTMKEDTVPIHEYDLTSDPPFFQVEPEASYWLRCPFLTNVQLKDIQDELDDYFRSHPYPASDSDQAQSELDIIQFRFDNAEVDSAFDQGQLSRFLKDPAFFKCPPAGAVLSCRPLDSGFPPIRNGGELARLFEAETPGLWHRHVLNVILDTPQGMGGWSAFARDHLPAASGAVLDGFRHGNRERFVCGLALQMDRDRTGSGCSP